MMLQYSVTEQAMGLLYGAQAFAVQTISAMGGIRVVEILAIAGFAIGFLACLLELKLMKRRSEW